MPIQTIKLMPGVNVEVTQTLGVAQITETQLVRFRYAGPDILIEKLGGWEKFYPLSMGSTVRDLHAWEGIIDDTYLAAGAEESLDVIVDSIGSDITPRTETTNPAVSFSTTNGDTEVTIDDAGITMSAYNSIFIATPVSVGGIVLFGSYAVTSVVDADTYTITAASAATATVAAGGAVPEFVTTDATASVLVNLDDHGYSAGDVFPVLVETTVGGITFSGPYIINSITSADQFEIIAPNEATATTTGFMNSGDARITAYIVLPPSGAATGYGGGGYGLGTYGGGLSPTPSTGTPITATNWTLDNWGAFLIATPADGPIYYWSPYDGLDQARRVTEAPTINGGAFVSQNAQILVAWASSSTDGIKDPLQINWSNILDFTDWTVTSQTQAGGYRLPTGSRIVGGFAAPNFNLIWTDLDLWAMNYIGPPLVFGFNVLGTNCGMVSRHGYAVLNSIIYWVGQHQVYALTGETVQPVPCPVWDYMFQDMDMDNLDKVCMGSNSLFNEITVYYPSISGGTGENDKYVKFNPILNTWDTGTLDRTAWIDQSPVGHPVGSDVAGYIYQHENSHDADGQPMNSWFRTGYFNIAEGDAINFVDWLMPDFKTDVDAHGYEINITFSFTDYPNGSPKERGPYTVNTDTQYVNTRFRGRFVSILVESSDLGSFWRMGAVKIRSTPDGKR